MLSQPKVQVLTQEKDKENENDSLKQLEDYGESEVEVESDSDGDAGKVTITPSLKQKFVRFYNAHGTNEERRKWKEDHKAQKCTNCASLNQPCITTPDLKIVCSECHTSRVTTCSKMETFRKDLMMPKMGIREVEVWETLNREYLRDKGKEKRKEKFGSKDDEEDELELDEGEWRVEGYRGLSARGRADPEKSPAKRVHSLRKVEVVIQTRKKRDRDEDEKNTETTATNPGFATLSETSRSGGTDSPKNQPAKTHEHKRQRRLTEKAQAEAKNKKVTTLQSSRAALNPNSATPFSPMPSHVSTLNQNVVPATSSRFALPAPASLRTPSNALQLVSSVPHVPPSTPVANDLEPDLRLSVIKRQLEDLCSDFRYGRIDVQNALGRIDEVAARIGRCASVASG